METCSTEIIKKKLIPMTIKENNITGTKYPRLVLSIIGDSRTFVPKPWLTPVFQLGLIETAKGANDCLILYEGSEEKISTLVREAVQNFRVLKKDDDKTFISFVRIRSPLFEEETGSNAVQNMDKEDEICFTLKGDDYVELLSNISREYVPLVELGQDNNLKMPVLVIVAEGESATIELVVNLVECCIPVLVLKGSGKAADLIADCLDDSSAINLKASLLLGTFIHSGEMAVLKNHMRKIRKKKQFVNVLDISTQDETQFPEAVSNAIIRAWAQGGTDKPVISDNTDLMKVKTTEPDKIYESTRNGNQDVPEVISPTEMSDGTFLPALNIGSENYNVDTSDAFDNSLNNKPGCSSVVKPNGKSRKNRINPKSVTLHNAKMGGEVKQFMTKYQESLTPASLPLYFYIAYQFIQEMSNKDDKRQNFQILLKQALVANRVDYVAVLLQEDKVEFDMQYFPYIYNEVLRCSCINAKNKGDCQHMWSILEGASPASSRLLLPEINEKGDQKEKYQKRIQAGRQLCQKFLHYSRKSYKAEDFEAVEDRNTRCEMDRDMFQDLLIWAIFCNRRELATLFWSKCPNQLETAVLASCVLKRMATIARSGKDQFLYNSIKEHAVLFEKRSIELQTVLYNEDSEIAMELVMADCTVWNIKVNPLECAHDNTMYDFIAHSCAQRRLNTIWYNKIGATLGEFWWNGFFCGCKTIGERGKTSMLLPKFIFAPLTRFIIHYILFIGALVCFSAFLMIELSEFEGLQSIKFYESVLYIWLLGDMVEEYRGVISWNNERISNRFSNEDGIALSQTISYRLKKYLFNFWNALDVFSYIITIAAILIRFLMKSSYDDIGTSNYTIGAKTARRSYSLSLFTMYMRFLHATLMSRKLGPKILMIKEMLKDLFRFIGILFVFMVGIGVLYHANMYPAHEDMWNSKDWTYWRIWKIMYIPYWQIYGELFLNEFQANSTTPCTTNQSEWEKNPDVERCNEYDWVLIVIAALYLLVSNLLLVNLVIALFRLTSSLEIAQMAVIMMSLIGLLFLATSTEGSYKKGVVISGESAYRCGDEFAFNNVHWWYDYHLSPWEHHKINCSDTIRSGYVPMAWKWRVHSPFYILQNAKYFLGFNEPNHPNQANMTPQEAAIHWKTIESKAHGKILVSPAVAHCSHCNMDPFAWLDSFFQHCPDCRVDHIATHDYHCHADDTMNYLKKLWERYHKPIWLTEFACPGNHGTSTQLAYMKDILPRLEAADYVYRYSWFVSRRTGNAYTTTHVSLLHQHSSSLTTIGQYYNDFM